MPASNVVYLQPRHRPEAGALHPQRVVTAMGAALLRTPPAPTGLAACVGYLQGPVEQLSAQPMCLRALQTLRASLFVAPGRDLEMALLWREALATACYARVIATAYGLDVSLLTGAGLLHRSAEICALRALAIAECEAGQRLVGPVMQQILEARDDELVARVTRDWQLSGDLRLLILSWRDEQQQPHCQDAVSLLTMAQALATELVHDETCTPGLVDAAREVLSLPLSLVEQARSATTAIAAMLDLAAPAPDTGA